MSDQRRPRECKWKSVVNKSNEKRKMPRTEQSGVIAYMNFLEIRDESGKLSERKQNGD